MPKKIVVISLGGSLIIPDDIDVKFLKNFRSVVRKHSNKYKFVIVCGGGSIARKYISALREVNAGMMFQSFLGISSTRTNARFMSHFFNQKLEMGVPEKIQTVKNYLKTKNIVFCGALEYKPNQTSDSTAAIISSEMNAIFINLTNVQGLYDKNPKEFKNAKFISDISWKNFYRMANRKKFVPGQHFVLDQSASKIIMDNRIRTHILGKDLRQLDNLLNGKRFKGTTIHG